MSLAKEPETWATYEDVGPRMLGTSAWSRSHSSRSSRCIWAVHKLNLFLDTSSVAISIVGRPAHGQLSQSATQLGEVIKVLATCWMALCLLF
jgi:hypothetical protein